METFREFLDLYESKIKNKYKLKFEPKSAFNLNALSVSEIRDLQNELSDQGEEGEDYNVSFKGKFPILFLSDSGVKMKFLKNVLKSFGIDKAEEPLNKLG